MHLTSSNNYNDNINTLYYDNVIIRKNNYCLAASKNSLAYVGKENCAKLSLRTFYPNSTLIRNPQVLVPYIQELKEYFAGTRKNFTLPIEINKVCSPFQQQVLEKVAQIPYGKTVSYGKITAAINNPGAIRAVAHAVALNPVLFFIPCHRVILNNGKVGKYRLGTKVKARLINLEKSYSHDNS